MKKIPERTCIGCGEKKEKTAFLRIVKKPDGSFSLDPTGRLNGRGAYICNDPACLEKAFRKKALDRAFKEAVPADVLDTLREGLAQLGK